jgi:Antitoxin SocA-like, Panacea domain
MQLFSFRSDKFAELMLYVAREAADDPTFGAVKLNKVLFYADFGAYAELGQPVTGARYQRLHFGPAARAMLPVQNELIRFGHAALEFENYFGLKQSRLVPKRDPDLSQFSQRELDLVDRAIKTFWGMDATSLSQLSHDESKGWQIVQDGEDIPYGSVFLSTEEPPGGAIELGQRLASQHGWKSR